MQREIVGRHAEDVRMTRLLVATTNTGKLREIRLILSGLAVELVSLEVCPGIPPADETAETFAENAREKALYYAAATGLLTVAEDSGLEIDALGGAPGVHSARYGLPLVVDYQQKFEADLPAATGAWRGGQHREVRLRAPLWRAGEASCSRRAQPLRPSSSTPRGEGGFGYDPILYYPPLGRTLAELLAREQEKAAMQPPGAGVPCSGGVLAAKSLVGVETALAPGFCCQRDGSGREP